jgi:hypothetical protein
MEMILQVLKLNGFGHSLLGLFLQRNRGAGQWSQ